MDALILDANKIDGLKAIFDRDYDQWSNFDSWDCIGVQQWIFARALDLYRGRTIDIRCDCCENIYFLQSDFENIKKEKCYGKKSVYMIKKIFDEIVLANEKREGDGTYSA